jgi:hypothetical protein
MAGYTSTAVTAVSREQMRNGMETSMLGRRAGIDFRGFEVGEEDTRLPVDVITTTVQTSLIPNGFSIIACTVASTAVYTLQNPVPGIYKQITQITTSTGTAGGGQAYIQLGANANIVTSAGSSFNQVVLAGIGHTASLSCVSTSGGSLGGPVWISASVASPGITFSTY